jgi:putative transposase
MEKRVEVVLHLTHAQLLERIRREKNSRVLKRLFFIQFVMEGMSIAKASEKVGVTRMVGYLWLRRWNEGGVGGLVPKSGGGRPPKLSGEQREQLAGFIRGRCLPLEEIKRYVEEVLGVCISDSRIRFVLKGMGVRHAKPWARDYRRPGDANVLLKKA